MKKILLGAAALAAMAAPAFAADMPARPYTKAPAYTAPQVVYNWTGFYIGGHVGGAFAGNNSLHGSDARFLGGHQGGLNPWSWRRRGVAGSLVGRCGYHACNRAQRHQPLESRRYRWTEPPQRRAHRQGRRKLPVWLGWPCCLQILIRRFVSTPTG